MYRSNPTSQSTFPSTRTLKVRAFRALRAAASRVGLQVVPKTYYSPIPDLDTLPPGVFDRRSALRGIHFDLDEQVAWIEQNLAEAMREFAPPRERDRQRVLRARRRGPAPRRRAWPQAAPDRRARLRPLDAVHGRRGRAQPGRGRRDRAADVRPVSQRRAARTARVSRRWRRYAAQDVPLEVFTALEAGDVLFVDTTHTVKVDSDVNRIVLEVLPALAPGVLVHVHDIFLPYEYPRRWHEESGFHWAEQYLLQAFLAGNPGFEVRAATFALCRDRPDAMARLAPTWRPGAEASAFWFSSTGDPAAPPPARATAARLNGASAAGSTGAGGASISRATARAIAASSPGGAQPASWPRRSRSRSDSLPGFVSASTGVPSGERLVELAGRRHVAARAGAVDDDRHVGRPDSLDCVPPRHRRLDHDLERRRGRAAAPRRLRGRAHRAERVVRATPARAARAPAAA